jgi:hypothetical protein
VPINHDFAMEGPRNPVGVRYILMNHAHGSPLDFPSATSEQQRKVLEQLTDIFIELDKLSFSAIGSFSKSGAEILDCTNEDTTDVDVEGNVTPVGPFSDNASYLAARIDFGLKLISLHTERHRCVACPSLPVKHAHVLDICHKEINLLSEAHG